MIRCSAFAATWSKARSGYPSLWYALSKRGCSSRTTAAAPFASMEAITAAIRS